jgi:hypothetical protein
MMIKLFRALAWIIAMLYLALILFVAIYDSMHHE